jgi:hypothetical protein
VYIKTRSCAFYVFEIIFNPGLSFCIQLDFSGYLAALSDNKNQSKSIPPRFISIFAIPNPILASGLP